MLKSLEGLGIVSFSYPICQSYLSEENKSMKVRAFVVKLSRDMREKSTFDNKVIKLKSRFYNEACKLMDMY